jgi:hypothetical protein
MCSPGQPNWLVPPASQVLIGPICASENSTTTIRYGANEVKMSARESPPSGRPALRSATGSWSTDPPAITGGVPGARSAPDGCHTRFSATTAPADTSAAKMSHSL